MKILLFGKNGQVGWELNRSLQPLGEVIALGREDADFSSPEGLRKIVSEVKPGLIVNAAAYTAVDRAEDEEELAMRINGIAPGVLAEEASKLDALLIHYSTDYVFDGTKRSPYTETDEPNPVNVYGYTKLAGEEAVRASGCRYLILRTSWVYASRGGNFLKTIIRLAKQKNELKIIDDQLGTPTWARYISDVTANLVLGRMKAGDIDAEMIGEVFHLANKGQCSWYQFACEIIAGMKSHDQALETEIKAITTEQYNAIAKRPGYTVLSVDKIENEMSLHNVSWENAVKLCLEEVFTI